MCYFPPASVTFLPAGIFLGYILHFYILGKGENKLDRVIFFDDESIVYSACAAAVIAILVGIVMMVVKRHCKKFKFENFYFMSLGMVFILIGGIILQNRLCKYYV